MHGSHHAGRERVEKAAAFVQPSLEQVWALCMAESFIPEVAEGQLRDYISFTFRRSCIRFFDVSHNPADASLPKTALWASS